MISPLDIRQLEVHHYSGDQIIASDASVHHALYRSHLNSSEDPATHTLPTQKRGTIMLYRKFWRCLNTLGVWRDRDYLRRKELRTDRDDHRDIMPDCVIDVRIYIIYL